jgi:hypothetical protein
MNELLCDSTHGRYILHMLRTAHTAAIVLFTSALAEAQVIDGHAEPLYGRARAIQQVYTGFGNATNGGGNGFCNGSELDGAFAMLDADGGFLYLTLAGNLESNFNKLVVFIDSRPDAGQRELRGDNPDLDFNNLNRMGSGVNWQGKPVPGLRFDEGFAADAVMFFTVGGGDIGAVPQVPPTMYVNFGQLLTEGGGVGGYVGAGAWSIELGCNLLATNKYGLEAALNNSNIDGVSGDPAEPGSGEGVRTGLEIKIPLALIDWDFTSPIKVCAFVNNGGHDFMSNQVLGSLPAGSGNLGGDGSGGYIGGSSGVLRIDFAGIPGDQYVVVPRGTPDDGDCIADLAPSGTVDGADLGALLAEWGPSAPGGLADFNADGIVDGADLGVLLASWGGCR